MIPRVFITSLSVKVVLLLLEARGNRSSLSSPYRWATPESLSNVYNRCVFWWLNKLFLEGFQRDLTFDQLFELDGQLESATLAHRAQGSWEKADKTNEYALGWSIISCFPWPLLRPAIPRIALIGFNYSQSFLINRLIDLLSHDTTSKEDQNAA